MPPQLAYNRPAAAAAAAAAASTAAAVMLAMMLQVWPLQAPGARVQEAGRGHRKGRKPEEPRGDRQGGS
jgi:hypothetical protein